MGPLHSSNGARLGLASLCLGLALLGGASPARAQTLGVQRTNEELQDLWNRLRPSLQAMLFNTAKQQFDGRTVQSGSATVELRELQRLGLDAATGPGFPELTPDRVALRVPLSGHWKIEAAARVHVKLRLGFLRPSFTVPITLRVEDLALEGSATFDRTTDPERPTVRQVGTPKVDFKVKLRSSNFLYDILLRVLSPLGNHLAHKALDDALKGLQPQLQALSGLPGPIPGDGAAPLQDSGVQTPFEEVALNVDRRIRRDCLPHGTLLEALMDTPQTDSWLDAYRDGGPGSQGSVVGFTDGGDSAIWTGHYLASQAYRWSVTGDADALDNVRAAVDGIGKLIDVNGGTGLLARICAPENSLMGQQIQRDGVFRSAVINGVRWIGRNGGGGISRDQYIGVLFGLSLTYDLVADQQVKADCARRITQIVDYFTAVHWFVDEDRPALDAPNGAMPTFYHQNATQKLAWLLAGERMAPGRYAAQLAWAGPEAETDWFSSWTGTFGLDHYYKYNLGHVANEVYFRLEGDPARWQAMHRSWRIMRRYVGHHRNAHFDLIECGIDPASRAVYFPATREALRRFLGRNHREVAPPVVDLSNVVWVAVPQIGYTTSGSPSGAGLSSATVQMPSEPLDFDQRAYEGNFHWQRSPFNAASPNAGNPRKEKPGIDVTLPYWMGRALGCF
ncbi:MAG: hypothetical protein AB7N76_14875 [Planctomycetota bacterium]